jgi:hypothetical protein
MSIKKIKVILNFPTPNSQKKVQIFIGYVGSYCRFIEIFSRIARPLFSLLSKDTKFVWAEICQHALDELKFKVSKYPILRGPDWTLPFHIYTDASDIAVRVVLIQLKRKGPYAIYYASKNFFPTKLNYTVTKK